MAHYISKCGKLVASRSHKLGMRSDRPKLASPPMVTSYKPCVTLGKTRPLARHAQWQLREHMRVLGRDCDTNRHRAQLRESHPDCRADHTPKFSRNANHPLLEVAPTVCFLVGIITNRWRRFVISINVLAMVSRTKAARIAPHPRTVGRYHDVMPKSIVDWHDASANRRMVAANTTM